MSPQAVRVRTSSGWQDIAIQGPPGPQGPAAPMQSPFVICANAQANTMPRSYPFTLPSAITSAVLVVSLSGYPAAAPGKFAIGFNIDSGSGGSQSWFYGSRVEHCQLPTGLFQVGPLAAGAHNLMVRNDLNANMDNNDFITAYLDAVVIADPSKPQIVTTLPSTPVDGAEVYYQADATNGVVWHLRYNAASASSYKWEVLGGSPLSASSVTGESSPGSASWFATPSLTIPRAGEYMLSFHCDGYASINQVNIKLGFGVQLGDGTTPFGETWGSYVTWNAGGGAAQDHRHVMELPGAKRALTAGSLLKLYALAQTGWNQTSYFRTISAMPVRIS